VDNVLRCIKLVEEIIVISKKRLYERQIIGTRTRTNPVSRLRCCIAERIKIVLFSQNA